MQKAYVYLRCCGSDAPLPVLERDKQEAVDYYRAALQPKGYSFAGLCVDVYQPKKPLAERKTGREMNLSLREGDAVIAPRLFDAFCDLGDAIRTCREWFQRRVTFHALDCGIDTSTNEGMKLLLTIEALDAADRERHGERLRRGLETRKLLGKLPTGVVGPGVKLAGKRGFRYRVQCEHERSVMARIVRWRDAGCDWRDIWRHLLAHKIYRRNGAEWTETSIRRAYAAEKRLQLQEALSTSPTDAGSPATSLSVAT
jgi:hypothetical protein